MKENEMETKKEKRKNNNRRLLLLLLMVGITGIMLATTSYAWFTANQSVKVNRITVNVTAQNGVQLSTDGTNWKSIIQTTDIINAHNNYSTTTAAQSINQLPDALEPVSTIGTVDNTGKMIMYYGVTSVSAFTGSCSNTDYTTQSTCEENGGTWSPSTEGSYILTATRSTETRSSGADSTGKFIAFDLFFKLDVQTALATPMYITTSSGVTSNDTTDTGIKNAARVGFVVLGHTTAGDTLENIQNLNALDASPEYIWEPNYDIHTAAGVSAAYDTYGITTTQTGGTRLAYEGIVAPIVVGDNVLLTETNSVDSATRNTSFFDPVTIAYETPFAFPNYLEIFSLEKGITKVRIYMWVEGQDVDCENTASGGNINFDLQISMEDHAPAAPAEPEEPEEP